MADTSVNQQLESIMSIMAMRGTCPQADICDGRTSNGASLGPENWHKDNQTKPRANILP